MGKKIIFLFLFLFLFIATPLIMAKAPTSQFSEGYIIIGTPRVFLQQDMDFTYNFFVYNISNGKIISNATTNCSFYMANFTGDVTVFGRATYHTTDEYWSILIDGNNFSAIGNYAYGVKCQSPALGGADTGIFTVTGSGAELTESKAIIYIGLLGILILTFILNFFGMSMLPKENAKLNEEGFMSISYLKYFRTTLWITGYFLLIAIMFVSSNLSYAYLGEELFADILFAFYTILFSIAPLVIIVWLLAILAMVFKDRELRKMMNRGLGMGGKY